MERTPLVPFWVNFHSKFNDNFNFLNSFLFDEEIRALLGMNEHTPDFWVNFHRRFFENFLITGSFYDEPSLMYLGHIPVPPARLDTEFLSLRLLSLSNPFSLATTYLFFYSISILVLLLCICVRNGHSLSNNKITTLLLNEPIKRLCFVVATLGLLGVPPTWGFTLKVSLLAYLLVNSNFYLLLVFFLFTLVNLFLYLQVLRLSVNTKTTNIQLKAYLSSRPAPSFYYYFTLVLFSFFIMFALIFLRDFLILFFC